MQSGREETLEERYAIKFCFKLGKNDATETYGMLQTAFLPSCMNRAWVQEEILSEEASTSNRANGISTRTMHQSTTPSLSQTIWPRWASRHFLSLPIVETLLCDFCLFPKLRGCRYETIEMKEAVTKVIDTLTQEDFHGAF